MDLSASATEYASLIAATTPSTTTTNGNATVKCTGLLSNFSVTLSGDPNNGGGTQSYAFTVMVNGAPSTLACTVSQGATLCTNAGNVALTTGQTVNVRSVPAATPTVRSATWTATYTATGVTSDYFE